MVTDPWFHSWNPPTALVPDQHTFHGPIHLKNFSSGFNTEYPLPHKNYFGRPDTFLPYLLSLTFTKVDRTSPKKYEFPLERTGPFKVWYHWSELDFAYPSKEDREHAIFYGEFIPKNNLPLGLEVYKDRLFVTMPKWKAGVPATLTVLPREPKEPSPKLVPYPDWSWHNSGTCDGITSVFRIQADTCGRLWVLDSGQIQITVKPLQVCPPKLLIFDLRTDTLITKYIFPKEFIKQDSLYSNIVVDIRDDCHVVHAYLTDVWRFGIVVFSLEKMRGWRVTDHLFYPEPLAAAYKVHHLEFQWTDGIFGMSLSPIKEYYPDRMLYFHPMSSFREFRVKTSVICNETGWSEVPNAFQVMGQSRGMSGHVSASWMDRRGIMFFNMVTRDTVGCWDSRKPYKRANLGVVAYDSDKLVFPNDLKIDQEKRQSVWVLSNKLPFYLYEGLKKDQINFRIMSAYTNEAIENTICDPEFSEYDSYVNFHDEDDCY